MKSENKEIFEYLEDHRPYARAVISGGNIFPQIDGIVEFYQLGTGVIVVTEVENLPPTATNIFAYHIHSGNTCDNNFVNTGEHYNPLSESHPNHAGDMPPLFAFNGFSWSAFYTERFKINDIIGKTVIIHDRPDDFTTQPSGNSGEKIACGVISRM